MDCSFPPFFLTAYTPTALPVEAGGACSCTILYTVTGTSLTIISGVIIALCIICGKNYRLQKTQTGKIIIALCIICGKNYQLQKTQTGK